MTAPAPLTGPPPTATAAHRLAAVFAGIATFLSAALAALGLTGTTGSAGATPVAGIGSVGTLLSLLALAHIHLKIADLRQWTAEAGHVVGVVGTVEAEAPSYIKKLEQMINTHFQILKGFHLGHGSVLDDINKSLASVLAAVSSDSVTHVTELVGAVAGAAGTLVNEIPAAAPESAPADVAVEPPPVPDVAGKDLLPPVNQIGTVIVDPPAPTVVLDPPSGTATVSAPDGTAVAVGFTGTPVNAVWAGSQSGDAPILPTAEQVAAAKAVLAAVPPNTGVAP